MNVNKKERFIKIFPFLFYFVYNKIESLEYLDIIRTIDYDYQ